MKNKSSHTKESPHRPQSGKGDTFDLHVRIDKWLWAARFFKTRALAQEAIEGGKVYIDDVRAKPSRIVAVGQMLRIGTPRGEFIVTVTGLSDRRGPAPVAATLYHESDENRMKREEFETLRRLSMPLSPRERPNTQHRRLLRRIKEGSG